MQQTIQEEVQITRFNSENAQMFMFSNLPKRIEILEREQYLFLPKDWANDADLVALNFIANQRGYRIELADKAPKISSEIIFQEIEAAIQKVTHLELSDYAVNNRTQHLFFIRTIYQTIALSYKVDRFLIAQRLKKHIKVIQETEAKHDDLLKFTPEYRRLFTDIQKVINNNKII